jgi:hypothetical protein
MLTAIQRHDFDESGYLVVEGALSTALLQNVREASQALAAAVPGGIDRRIWHERALFRRPAFRKILDAEVLVAAATDLIGDGVQLLALDLLYTRAGKGEIGWHRDVGFVCSKTLSMNTGIYLQDMTEEMGPLRVVPGSHRREEPPSPGASLPDEKIVTAPAGAAVFSTPPCGTQEGSTGRLSIAWPCSPISAGTG